MFWRYGDGLLGTGRQGRSDQELGSLLWEYDVLRFCRLCCYLRQRDPDDYVGWSIVVYRRGSTQGAERPLEDPLLHH